MYQNTKLTLYYSTGISIRQRPVAEHSVYETIMSCRTPPLSPAGISRAFRQRLHTPRSHLRQYAYSTASRSTPSFSQYRRYTLPASATLAALAASYFFLQTRPPHRLEARPSTQGDALTSGAKVQITGQDHGDDVEKVDTGTSTVPHFPKSIWLPRSGKVDDGKSAALPAGIGMAQEEEEYQLLGLGVRKVSLFRIEVYVVVSLVPVRCLSSGTIAWLHASPKTVANVLSGLICR